MSRIIALHKRINRIQAKNRFNPEQEHYKYQSPEYVSGLSNLLQEILGVPPEVALVQAREDQAKLLTSHSVDRYMNTGELLQALDEINIEDEL